MNSQFKILFFSSFLLLLLSCNEKKLFTENGKLIEKTYFPNGKVKVERECLKSGDTLVSNGYLKEYYSDGQLMVLAFYKNNIQDSVVYIYNHQGTLISKQFRINKYLYGLQYQYYDNGKTKNVASFALDSSKEFMVKYDSEGNFLSFGGHIDFILRYDTTIHDSIKVANYIAVVPNLKTILNICLLDDNNHIVDTMTIQKFNFRFNRFYYPYKHRLEKSGRYKISFIGSLLDSATNVIIKKDTTQYFFNVSNYHHV